jgi:hypothetical protein
MQNAPASKAKLRVAFLLFYFEGWDAFEETFRRMQLHPRFEPFVVAIPRKLTGYEGWGDLELVTEFLDARGFKAGRDYFALDQEDSMDGLEALKRLAPDYIFLNYPWMRNYQPGYQLELLQWARVCYLPYFALPLVNEPGAEGLGPHMYTQPVHQYARLVFTPDLAITEALVASDRGERGVVFTGSPKLDAAVTRAAGLSRATARWPLTSEPARLRVVWAPHHSYNQNWLNFGNFADSYQQLLRFASSHPEIDFVLRPHPFLFSTMTGRGVIDPAVLDSWRAEWDALENTAIDADGDFVELFVACDLLLTDGISFLAEYPLAIGRPAIFLERQDHWPFTELGALARTANIGITELDEFERLVDQVQAGGSLPYRADEIASLRAQALPYPGKAAELILDAVLADWG